MDYADSPRIIRASPRPPHTDRAIPLPELKVQQASGSGSRRPVLAVSQFAPRTPSRTATGGPCRMTDGGPSAATYVQQQLTPQTGRACRPTPPRNRRRQAATAFIPARSHCPRYPEVFHATRWLGLAPAARQRHLRASACSDPAEISSARALLLAGGTNDVRPIGKRPVRPPSQSADSLVAATQQSYGATQGAH